MAIIAPIDPCHKSFATLRAALHLMELGIPVNWDDLNAALRELHLRQTRLLNEQGWEGALTGATAAE